MSTIATEILLPDFGTIKSLFPGRFCKVINLNVERFWDTQVRYDDNPVSLVFALTRAKSSMDSKMTRYD